MSFISSGGITINGTAVIVLNLPYSGNGGFIMSDSALMTGFFLTYIGSGTITMGGSSASYPCLRPGSKWNLDTESPVGISSITSEVDGMWCIENDRLQYVVDAGAILAQSTILSTKHIVANAMELTCKVNFPSEIIDASAGPVAGIFWRATNAPEAEEIGSAETYRVFLQYFSSFNLFLSKFPNNITPTPPVAIPFTFAPDTDYAVRIVCLDRNIKVYIDEVLKFDVDDDGPFPLGERVGFLAQTIAVPDAIPAGTGIIFDDMIVKINALNIAGGADVEFCIPTETSGIGTFSIKVGSNPSDPTPIFFLDPHYIPDTPTTSCEGPGSGNIIVNGASDIINGSNIISGTGGIVVNGAATGTEITTANFAYVAPTMVGGIRIDCEGLGFNVRATYFPTIPDTGSGGIVMGGGAGLNLTEIASGGVTMGGAAVTIAVLSFTGGGTIVVNGGIDLDNYLYAMTGGINMGGEAITINEATTASGGITMGGEATAAYSLAFVASGGVILSGLGGAIVQQNYLYTGTGNLFVNLGIPGADFKLFVITGSGLSSLDFGGSADVSTPTLVYEGGGTIFTSGFGLLTVSTLIYCASGDITIGGFSTQGFVLSTQGGGVIISGTATLGSSSYVLATEGGVTVNGDSNEDIGIVTTGIVTVSGFGSYRVVLPVFHPWSGFLRPTTPEERLASGQVLNIVTPGTNPNSYTIPHEIGVCIPPPNNTQSLRNCELLSGQSSQKGAWIANVILRRQAPFGATVTQGFEQVTPS